MANRILHCTTALDLLRGEGQHHIDRFNEKADQIYRVALTIVQDREAPRTSARYGHADFAYRI